MALNLDGDREKVLKRYFEAIEAGKKTVLLCGLEHSERFDGAELRSLGGSDAECARRLFGMLRALEKNYDFIIAGLTRKGEVADSVLNRLLRAAGRNVF